LLVVVVVVVVEEFPNDAVITSAPAKTTSIIRIGKIFRGIFFIVDMGSLTGTVKLLTP